MTRRMYRYLVPVSDRAYTCALTSGPVAVAAVCRELPDFAVEFWAEYDPDAAVTQRTFKVFGTGYLVPDNARWAGTCARLNGLVWHLYEIVY
jgi:hypothetical protein